MKSPRPEGSGRGLKVGLLVLSEVITVLDDVRSELIIESVSVGGGPADVIKGQMNYVVSV